MAPPCVLMVGTGEYTTGFVNNAASTSDKKVGVVALVMFDMRRRGKVSKLSMAGVSGRKFPAIRQHLDKNISQAYNSMDVSFESYPSDTTSDAESYKHAIDALPKGSAVTIFTPDPTHFPIAMYAIERGHHVLITKPATQLLADHVKLVEASRKHNVLVYIEHHKRFDPAYADARFKARTLGDFNYFYSYMSQPKSQLSTFAAWAGKDSDISYYLNSHHIDICASMVTPLGWHPTRVTASGSTGIAESLGCQPGTQDTITLLVDWQHESQTQTKNSATAIFTASWTAPQRAGVHSQQRFHYVGSTGEIHIDQAKRGYEFTPDPVESADDTQHLAGQITWINPFYMRYSPDEEGNFAGQSGYGYVSFEKFIDAVTALNEGKMAVEDVDRRGLPTIGNTVVTGAILEAGRRSLDEGRRPVEIVLGKDGAMELK